MHINIKILGTLIAVAFPLIIGIVLRYTGAADVATTAEIINVAPTVDTIRIATTAYGTDDLTSSGILPNVGTDRTIHINGQISDANGENDIASSTINLVFHKTSATSACVADNNDCYRITTCDTNYTDGDDTQISYNCEVPLAYWIDATDAASIYVDDTWTAYIEVEDMATAQGTLSATIEVNSLLALNLPDTIDYSTRSLGEVSSSTTNVETIITQRGNTNADVYAAGTRMNCSVLGSLATSSQAWALDSVGFSSSTILTDTLSATSRNINLRTSETQELADSLFWNIAIPASGVKGTCTGSNTLSITAVELLRSWQIAQLIETDDGNAVNPQIAIDGNNNAIAVWSQSDGTRNNIWSNRYTASTNTWGTAELLETDNAGDAYVPQIAIDGNNNAIVVWYQSDGVRTNLYSNRYTASTNTWGIAELIETDNVGNASSPQIAIDANNNAVVVWAQNDGARDNVWSNRYTASTNTWGTAELIETDDAGGATAPQIAVDGNNNAIAVWNQSDGTRDNIWSNRYTASTNTWGAAELLETDDAGTANSPQIAIDANNNAMAIWYQSDGTSNNIYSNRYTISTNSWGTAQLVEVDAGAATGPQIAIDTNNNAMAVWRQHDGARFSVYANRYTASTNTWGTAELIETDNAGQIFTPQIAIDANNNAMAVWRQFDGTIFSVYSNRYTASTNTWGTAELVETDNVGGVFTPQIAIDGSNNAITIWANYDGTRNNIFSNRYSY